MYLTLMRKLCKKQEKENKKKRVGYQRMILQKKGQFNENVKPKFDASSIIVYDIVDQGGRQLEKIKENKRGKERRFMEEKFMEEKL